MTPISNIINRLWLLSALLRRALRGLLHDCFGLHYMGLWVRIGWMVHWTDREDATRPGVR